MTTVSVRDAIQSKIDPVHRQQKVQAGATPLAQPIDLLGAPPERAITYISESARALLSAEAVNSEVPYTPPFPDGPGTGFEAQA